MMHLWKAAACTLNSAGSDGPFVACDLRKAEEKSDLRRPLADHGWKMVNRAPLLFCPKHKSFTMVPATVTRLLQSPNRFEPLVGTAQKE